MAKPKHLRRNSVYDFDPDDLTIIGRDTEDVAGDHPAYDERSRSSINMRMVQSILDQGVLQPITTVGEGEGEDGRTVVLAGRQRTIHARAANIVRAWRIAMEINKSFRADMLPEVELISEGMEPVFGVQMAKTPEGWGRISDIPDVDVREELDATRYVYPLELPVLARSLKELGKNPNPEHMLITVPASKFRGNDRAKMTVMVTENAFVKPEELLHKALKAARFMAQGATLKETAQTFDVTPVSIKQWLTLLNATPEVLEALKADHLSASAAIELAGMTRAKQNAALKELLEDNGGKKISTAAVKRKREGAKKKRDGRSARVKHSSLMEYVKLPAFLALPVDAQAMAMWILDPNIDPEEYEGELKMALRVLLSFGADAPDAAAKAKAAEKARAAAARARTRTPVQTPETETPKAETPEPEPAQTPEPETPETPEPETPEIEDETPEPETPEIEDETPEPQIPSEDEILDQFSKAFGLDG